MEMKVMVAQINPTIGDLDGNFKLICGSIAKAAQMRCDVVVLPELATVGYPPRDLLYSAELWKKERRAIERIHEFVLQQAHQITAIVGGLHEEMQTAGRYARYNAAWILDRHFGKRVVHKHLLPCYDVFDETRYFSSGADDPYFPIPIRIVRETRVPYCEYNVPCDILICEDIWNNEFCGGEEWMKPATYHIDPLSHVAGRGPLFILNGSPFWIGKIEKTREQLTSIARRIRQPVIWCNQVGAHDDIITGGYSMVALPEDRSNTFGRIVSIRQARAFEEDELVVRFARNELHLHSNLNEGRDRKAPLISPAMIGNIEVDVDNPDHWKCWTILKALCLHMADYKRRCGFKRAVLGLSGGIDSAVVAVVAKLVFGSENVMGIAMPSPFSSEGSVKDARALAANLGIGFQVKSITDTYQVVRKLFLSGGKQRFDNSLTDENIQPRVRAMILMAHSNEFDPCLLLTTGNKSEITVGYCTIYGDMCGGLAVISDIWKTELYPLTGFMNYYLDGVIPENTITKPASPELKPDQKDTDSLPPYPLLDPLLRMFVEQEMSPEQVFASRWFKEQAQTLDMIDSGTVRAMYRKYRIAEFKRQQMPPGPKLQQRSFGSGRRMPIAMKLTTVQ
ncbi:MAG: NAD+ synthase [Promethearchaeota archaeon]|jgi:NAD+ synthetase